MRKKTFEKAQAAVAAIMAGGVAVTSLGGQVLAALAIVIAGIGILAVFRGMVKEKMTDEMVFRMSEKASRRAFQIFTFSAGMIGVATLALRDMLSQEYFIAGQVLAYSACVLLVLYTGFYSYYGRKGV